MKIKSTLIFALFSLFLNAQVDNHVFVERGSTTELTWKASGDYSAYDSLYFVVKPCTSNTCARLIQKPTSVSYSAPYTTMICTLYVDETASFNVARYYYSIYAYGPDTVWVTSGNFNLMLNGQTPTDGVASTTPYYTVALDTPNTANTFIVGQDSNNIWYRRTANAVRTILGIDTLTNAGSLPDSIIYTSETADFVTKSTAQTITGVKTFDTTVVHSDSNYYYQNIKGWGNQGDWLGWQRNFWVNTTKQTWRPDQCWGFGFNWAQGGGRVKPNDNAMGFAMESAYQGGMEAWFGFYGDRQSRPWMTVLDSTTNKVYWMEQWDEFLIRTRHGNLVMQAVDSSHWNWTVPILFSIPAAVPFLAQANGDSTASLCYPYFDANNRYYLANANSIWVGSRELLFYQTGLRFDDSYGTGYYYGLNFLNGDSNTVHSVYYYDDELRIQADTFEKVVIKGSELIYEDDGGNNMNVIYPSYPLDSTGLDINRTYVDENTGHLLYRIPERLILNGKFESWTWDINNKVHPTYYTNTWYGAGDTAVVYTENSSNRLHLVSDGSERFITDYTESSCSIGEVYGYSFNLINFDADSTAIAVCGVPINPNYVDIPEGHKTGEVTATTTFFFSIDNYNESADVIIDNLRIWKKTGSGIAQTYEVKNSPINILNPTDSDTVGLGRKEVGAIYDSLFVYDILDSVAVQLFYRTDADYEMITTPDTLTTDATITFDTSTVPAGAKVYLYFVFVGDSEAYLRSQIYWRE